MRRAETFAEFVHEAERLAREHRDLRPGQAYYNALWASQPELAEIVRGSEVDPYYHNGRLPDFLELVERYWDGVEIENDWA